MTEKMKLGEIPQRTEICGYININGKQITVFGLTEKINNRTILTTNDFSCFNQDLEIAML